MAEVLLRERLTVLGVDATVRSAGELRGGASASLGSLRAMAQRGLDLRQHVSRNYTADDVERADLVLAMARQHLRRAVAMRPPAFTRSFTLKELVRRGEAIGPRRREQSFEAWLADAHTDRTASQLLGDDPMDDVGDPIGGPDHLYEETAVELAELVDRLVDLAFATERETA